MTPEQAETIPDTGDPQRYPTARELVDAALAECATLAAEPTRTCPNYAVPGADLDGNPQQLVVVALGGRVALAGPGGMTAVLCADAVGALAASLEDILVAKVHGGDVRLGKVEVDAKYEVFVTEKANISVTARPYTDTMELYIEFMSARFTCHPTLDEIRKLKQMLADAETIMLGWHKPTTNEPTN